MPPIQYATQLPHVRASIAHERRFIKPFTAARCGNKALTPLRFNSRKEVKHVGPEQQQRHAESHGTKHQGRRSNATNSTPRSVQDRRERLPLPLHQPVSYQGPLQYRRGSSTQTDHSRHRSPAGEHEKRREQTHRSVRTRYERDPDPMRPLQRPTDHLGYVTWQNWDCRPWETSQLRAYHLSRHYHLEKRTMKFLRQARSKAKRHARDMKSFWYNYHARALSVSYTSRGSQLCLIETGAITTLLRTAPKVIHRRLASSILPVDNMARELHRLLQELHELQRPRLNQVPLTHELLATKAIIVAQDLEQIETMYNASSSWQVEPMIVSLTLATHRLSRVLESFSEFKRLKARFLPGRYIRSSENLQRAIQHNIWELCELGHELKALRYYQRNKCLNSPSLTSLKAGKRLWQQLRSLHQSEATGVGISFSPGMANADYPQPHVFSPTGIMMRTNVSGLFNFKQWTGEDWNVDSLQHYASNLAVTAAASAEAEYQAVAMRPQHTIPPRIRDYLLSSYSALKQANERLHPYVRYYANTSVVMFLLRTAPARFSGRFDRTLQALGASNYDLMIKVEDLRMRQTVLAYLPTNPLLFQSLAIRTMAESAAVQATISKRLDGKKIRAAYKAIDKFNWASARQLKYEEDSKRLTRLLLKKHRRSADWTWHYPYVVAEPLYNAFSRFLIMYTKMRERLLLVRYIVIFFSGNGRWRQMNFVSESLRTTMSDILRLARYFTALRYYRAQHFPGSISASEMFVPDALLTASSRARSGSANREISSLPVDWDARTKTVSTKVPKGRVQSAPVAVIMSRKSRRHKRQIDLSEEDKNTCIIPRARSKKNHDPKQDDRQRPRAPNERPLHTRSGRRV